ncbi:Uncharacterised protein [Mycobacteroides abscessus subsp. abscessus]|nr:Uncharacterised protein [Mycobacteroides abscessus subsp. abscessus]
MPGDLLLIGRSKEHAILAAAHLIFKSTSSLLQVHVAAIGVCVSIRGAGGAIADEAVTVVRDVAREKARTLGLDVAILTANVHTENSPSESLVLRAGFEPLSVPSGSYQQWVSRVAVD